MAVVLPVAVAGTDVSINEEDLPQAVAFDGSGSLADAPKTITGYLWEVLYQSPDSAATLLDAATATPTLDSADVWWNTRVYLRVKDSAHYWSCWAAIDGEAQAVPAPGTAWDDPPAGWRLLSPLEAPDSAFVHVRILSYEMGLQKIAEGERNYTAIVDEWANALDLLEAWQATHVISDHQDTVSTGAELDTLTQGGVGDGMHSHAPGDLPVATAAARGVVYAAETPVDPLNPRAANVVRFTLCGNTEPETKVAPPAGDPLLLHWFSADTDFTVTVLTLAMRDGGTAAGGGYRFQLIDWNGVAQADTGAVVPGGDNSPITKAVVLGTPLTITSSKRFGIKVLNAPAGAPDQGVGLSVVLWCQRAY